MQSKAGRSWNKLLARPAISVLCLLLSLAALAMAHHYRAYPQIFWDTHVYADAIRQWRAGTDAYQPGPAAVPFVYPPVSLVAASVLARILTPAAGWSLYLALTFAATLAILWLMVSLYAKKPWLTFPIACAIFFAGPRLAGSSTLLSGNINTVCFAAILTAAIAGIRHQKWAIFYVAVAAASLIKISFLALLLLPLFASTEIFPSIAASVATCAATAAAYLTQRKIFPAAYKNFQQNLLHHALRTHHDGYAVLGTVRHLLMRIHAPDTLTLPTIAHITYCVIAISALILARTRFHARSLVANPTWLSIILITAITINPRMVDYDAAIAAIPAIAILIAGLTIPTLRTFTAAALLLSLICFIAAPTGTGTLTLLLSALITGYMELSHEPQLRPLSEQP